MLTEFQTRSFSSTKNLAKAVFKKHDVVVIGGGAGGYFAAIKAAQLGFNTACIEKRGVLGGTCLNVGCIPSKTLLNNTHLYHEMKTTSAMRGIDVVGELKPNVDNLMKAKESVIQKLRDGSDMLFKKNGVVYYKGNGSFVDEFTVQVDPLDGGEKILLEAKNIIIATGSQPTPFPGIEIDQERIIDSTGALSMKQIPKKMVIIGAGIIGIEMGTVWSRLGAEVTVLEFMPSIGGPGMDSEISKETQKFLAKQGFKFQLGVKVRTAVRNGDEVNVEFEDTKTGEIKSIKSDVVLVAVGRKPYSSGLNADKINLQFDEKKRIIINSEYRTNHPHIQCIGDVTFGPMLAHKAEEEAIAAVENIKYGHGHINYDNIPSILYSHPEVAWTGKTEEELKAAGIEYKTGKFPFKANSRATTSMDTEGFVKFIADAETKKILGVHIIGANAGEMIAEAALAIEHGFKCEDIYRVCHAHPTLSEAFKDAAMTVFGKSVNL